MFVIRAGIHKMLVRIANREEADRLFWHWGNWNSIFFYHLPWRKTRTYPGRVAQLVTCLTADTRMTADPGIARSIPARSNTFLEIDHETISMAILLHSADSKRAVVSYKRNYVHEVLVNHLVKLAQEKSMVRWTDRPNMTIAVDWAIKHQTNQPTRTHTYCRANQEWQWRNILFTIVQ